ncbi:MAG: aminotransferase class V-fold PLP-dependent enzyme [Oligoflexia bacterium]|nr:aminotransferase class V-fold PLP-dependent enzyme [Oligoflexia bacterium]
MEEIIYLDNAASTFPKPDIVHDTVYNFYRNNGVNPGRTGCDLALNAEKMIHDTRKKYSNFFNQSLVDNKKNKDPNRLIFTMNATMGLNIIVNGTVKSGDHIITTMLEHNSVLRPVNHKKRENNVDVTFVAPDAEGYINPDAIEKAFKSNTKLVIVNHASNVSGVVQDIKSIGAICKKRGVQFAVDSAQTAGVIPIDMAESNIDFLCFTGHKGLFAPTGTGGVCVADHAEITSCLVGGTGVRSVEPYHIEEFPYRLEAGTLNLAGIAGLSAGLDYVIERGINNIYSHEMELLRVLQDGLSTIKGVKIWGTKCLETNRRVSTLSMTIENYDASDVGTILDVDYGIQTRTGLHCAPLIHQHYGSAPRGTVRFSIGTFNTRIQIEKALKAVSEVAADRQ